MTPRSPRLARLLVRLALRGEAREAIAGDLDEEFADRIEGGEAPSAARRHYWRQALASIASVGRAGFRRPEFRFSWIRGSLLDVRDVARGLAASPGFVAVAILSLAIGIGANVAVFSIVRALMLEELPVLRPSELRWVNWTQPKDLGKNAINFNSSGNSNYSYPEYAALMKASAAFGDLCALNFLRQLNLSAPGQPAIVAAGLIVSGDYFTTMHPVIALGRPLTPGDVAAGAPNVAVISHSLWRRLFGSDPSAVGRVLSINQVPFEVVGVTGPRFLGVSIGGFFPPTDVTVPLTAQPIVAPMWAREGVPLESDSQRNWIRVLMRTRPEIPDARVEQAFVPALQRVLAEAGATAADLKEVTVQLKAANRGLDSLRTSAAPTLQILAAVSGIVLLIACTNLAGLMLARGMSRRRETSVRRALGANRLVLVRRWLIESTLLAGAGGLAGVVAAAWTGPVVARMLTVGLGTVEVDLRVDWRLVGPALLITLATAILSGLLPALRLTRADSTEDLRHRVVGAVSSRWRGGRLLIALQMAVTVPLLVGALLFLRTLHNLAGVDLGFDPHGLVLFQINPLRTLQPFSSETVSPDTVRVMRRLVDRLEAIPGVASATLIENPLVSGWTSNTRVTIGGSQASMLMNAVGPRFFETMRIPVIAGRELSLSDDPSAPPAVVINAAAASRFFPGASPVGVTFLVGKRTVQIVGVVADAVYNSLRARPEPMFYDAYLQRPGGTYLTGVIVRTMGNPARFEDAIRAAVASVDRHLPISEFKTQEDQIDQAIGKERVFARLLTLFGAFALLLACVGLHGLTAYSVARRTNEIGVRLALGAQRRQVVWLMLRQVVGLAAIGLTVGVPVALLSGPVVQTFLYGVEPRDLTTTGLAAVILLGVAVAAGWLPARRAARMEALPALRQE